MNERFASAVMKRGSLTRRWCGGGPRRPSPTPAHPERRRVGTERTSAGANPRDGGPSWRSRASPEHAERRVPPAHGAPRAVGVRPLAEKRGVDGAFSFDLPSDWPDLRGNERGQALWPERPLPEAHAWTPPHHDDTAKGRMKLAEAAGAWRGRKEDEKRMLTSWKAPGGPWTWRVADAECTFSNGGFAATRNLQTKPWCSVMAGALLTKGAHTWEVRLTGNTRAVRVGVATPSVDLHENLAWGRESSKSWVITDLGSLWHNETLLARCATFRHSSDVVGLHCDMGQARLEFSVNGVKQPDAFFEHLPSSGVVPVVCFREVPVTVEMRHVFSDEPPLDLGPFYNEKPVAQGQIDDYKRKLPSSFPRPR
ncbi:hypothetical protein DIPPA_35846 [Diplonema papillatum]|nr:hypothetical protein DIPPA_35846 [Diplonema papillatum]|eukprot:gene17312-26588_t